MPVKIRIWDYEEITKENMVTFAPLPGGKMLLPETAPVPDSGRRKGETEAEYFLRLLLRDLQTFAADAETMIRAYDPRCGAADDLVNDYDIHLEWAEKAVREKLITVEMLEKARAVDAKVVEMTNIHDPSLWTDEGLRTRTEWTIIRRLAREALEAMGYDIEPPPPLSM